MRTATPAVSGLVQAPGARKTVCETFSTSTPGVHSRTAGDTYCALVRCSPVGAVAACAEAVHTVASATTRVTRMERRTTELFPSLPPDWAAIYRSATEQLSCTNPSTSNLINRPSSSGHGGGQLFMLGGEESALIQMWVSAPP